VIAFVKGTVSYITEQQAIIDCNGIGYAVNAAPSTLSRLPRNGEDCLLHTHMQVKEDDMSLYGFLNREELRLFRLFIGISGIGPKVALAILSVMSPEQIQNAIASGDAVAFSKVSGVGKKTAQRITLELTDKIKLEEASPQATTMENSEKQDAIEGLIALGYSRSESFKAVLSVATEDMPASEIIRQSLKKLV